MTITSNAPEFVWVLTAKDFCRRAYDGPSGTHCLDGWRRKTFNNNALGYKAYAELSELTGGITYFNDTTPLKEVAKIWNQAMANLGYTEGNPEKPRKGKS